MTAILNPVPDRLRQGAVETVNFRTVLILLCFIGFFLPATGVITPTRASNHQPHFPITINGNAGFTSANGVTGGSGTPSDPYIIQGWDINASGSGCCYAGLVIQHTNASFIIRDVYVHSGLPLGHGISLSQVSNGFVEDSVASYNDFGIVVDTSTNVTVSGNTVYSNNPYGIYLYHTSNSMVSGNNVYSNQNAGIFLWTAYYVTVTDNLVHDQAFIGIDTYTTSYDTIVANNVSSNGWIGIRLYLSSYNLVYHNNLFSNGLNPPPYNQGFQVLDHPTNPPVYTQQNTTDRWDDGYPAGGNYYNDNVGRDNCSGPAQNICGYPDGISDGPPYFVPDTFTNSTFSATYYVGRDHYPLIKPFTTSTIMPDFDVYSNSSPTFSPGSSASITITLASIQNYADQITINTTTDAPNTSVSPGTTVISLNPSTQVNTILTVTASSNTALGTYYLDVMASTDSLSHTTSVTFNILPASQPPPTQPSQKPSTNAAPPSLTQLMVLLPIVTTAAVASVFTVLVWARKRSWAERQTKKA